MLDVFIKIAGGLRIDDPGIDLGISAAIYSSLVNEPLEPDSVYIGEIGLNGEIRNVSQIKRRIDESGKLGIKHMYLPFLGNHELKYSEKTKPVFLKNITQLFNHNKSD